MKIVKRIDAPKKQKQFFQTSLNGKSISFEVAHHIIQDSYTYEEIIGLFWQMQYTAFATSTKDAFVMCFGNYVLKGRMNHYYDLMEVVFTSIKYTSDSKELLYFYQAQ